MSFIGLVLNKNPLTVLNMTQWLHKLDMHGAPDPPLLVKYIGTELYNYLHLNASHM